MSGTHKERVEAFLVELERVNPEGATFLRAMRDARKQDLCRYCFNRRTLDNAFGELVTCPSCRTEFVAPVRTAEALTAAIAAVENAKMPVEEVDEHEQGVPA